MFLLSYSKPGSTKLQVKAKFILEFSKNSNELFYALTFNELEFFLFSNFSSVSKGSSMTKTNEDILALCLPHPFAPIVVVKAYHMTQKNLGYLNLNFSKNSCFLSYGFEKLSFCFSNF